MKMLRLGGTWRKWVAVATIKSKSIHVWSSCVRWRARDGNDCVASSTDNWETAKPQVTTRKSIKFFQLLKIYHLHQPVNSTNISFPLQQS